MIDALQIMEESQEARICAVVGRVMLTSSMIDVQLNRIAIAVFRLEPTPFLEPIVGSLETSRKIEILKQFARKIRTPEWRKGLQHYLRGVETLNRARNIAAHSVISIANEVPLLSSAGVAKLLKSLAPTRDRIGSVSLSELEKAASNGRATYTEGIDFLANFERAASKKKRRLHRDHLSA